MAYLGLIRRGVLGLKNMSLSGEIVSGRKNTDVSVRLSRVKGLALPFTRFLTLDTYSDSISSSIKRHQ